MWCAGCGVSRRSLDIPKVVPQGVAVCMLQKQSNAVLSKACASSCTEIARRVAMLRTQRSYLPRASTQCAASSKDHCTSQGKGNMGGVSKARVQLVRARASIPQCVHHTQGHAPVQVLRRLVAYPTKHTYKTGDPSHQARV